jgi:WD40 repeat protein
VRTEVSLPWPVWGVALTPDGRRAVVNGTSGWAVVDLDRGRLAARPTAAAPLEPIEIARSAAVSPDGRLAALGRAGGLLVLVDVRSGRAVRETTLPDGDPAVSVAWAGDGDVLLVGTRAGELHIRRVSDLGEAAPARLVTDGWVTDVQVSPTGDLAATVGTDGELLLWDTATWRPLGKRLTDGLGWGWASFAADGSSVRTQHSSGQLVQWSTDPDAWLAAACRVANRDLSRDEWALVHGDQPWRPTCTAGA